MRISDWSSDVCSSDLSIGVAHGRYLVAISAVLVGIENQGFTAVASLQRRAAADRDIGSVEVLRRVAIVLREGRNGEDGSRRNGEESCEFHCYYSTFC